MLGLTRNRQTLDKASTCSVLQGKLCLGVVILLPVESRTPSFAQLYFFDSDTEEQVNMRCCVMDGLDREIVATVQRVKSQVTSFVEMSLRADEFIRNQELLNVQFATHEVQGVDLGTHNLPTCNEVAARRNRMRHYFAAEVGD